MIDFLWENPTRNYPSWQIRPILDNWSKKDGVGYGLMFNALKKAIDKLNIPLNKVTHMRQHNIEYQGFQVRVDLFGDSTNCASNFIDVTLPLLCTVLVQDGFFLFGVSPIIG